MSEEGGVGRGAGKALLSHPIILSMHADLNYIKSLLHLKGEKSVTDLDFGTVKC